MGKKNLSNWDLISLFGYQSVYSNLEPLRSLELFRVPPPTVGEYLEKIKTILDPVLETKDPKLLELTLDVLNERFRRHIDALITIHGFYMNYAMNEVDLKDKSKEKVLEMFKLRDTGKDDLNDLKRKLYENLL